MTLTELRERIKEEVVLHEGDLKEWQWRRNGLLTEAEQDGISPADFMRIVNDVSYQLSTLFARINQLRSKADTYARADKKRLTNAHLDELVAEAERLTLSRMFVTGRWLPAILATIPEPSGEVPMPAPTPRPVPEVPTTIAAPAPAAGISREQLRTQIGDRLIAYVAQPRIPATALRELLQTIPADEAMLTEEVFSYLVSNFFKAVGEPQGNSLRERLGSTDWQNLLYKEKVTVPPVVAAPRHVEPTPVVRKFTATPGRVFRGQPVTLEWDVENLLAVTIDDLGEGLSPQNRGWVKPTKSTEYTLFDANNNPLSTVRVEVMPRDRSGLYGVLFALVLLLLIYWFIRSSTAKNGPEPKHYQPATELPVDTPPISQQPEPTPAPSTAETPADSVVETVATDDRSSDQSSAQPAQPDKVQPAPVSEPVQKPATPADARLGKYVEAFGDKSYDKVELGADDRGWRRARSRGRWGYIDQNDAWVIEPTYEAVTPFQGNTATAFLNGQLITIDRSGQQVRN